MDHILDPGGNVILWESVQARGVPNLCQPAFNALTENLVRAPVLDLTHALHDFYLEAVIWRGSHLVWQYALPAPQLSAGWIPFRRISGGLWCCHQEALSTGFMGVFGRRRPRCSPNIIGLMVALCLTRLHLE